MNQHFATHAASPDLRVTTLPNGVTIVTEAMPGVDTASLGIWVGAGSRHRRSARDIAVAIENVGGEIKAATSTEGTS